MSRVRDHLPRDGVPIVRLESDHLQVDVAPSVGGRVVSLIERAGGHEFLWRNAGLRLQPLPAGSEYDPNFYGGIDELLPNDLPETIAGVACPDHGELWTSPLDWNWDGRKLRLEGTLPRFGLRYERIMALGADTPALELTYRLSNLTTAPRPFLWKLHAAMAVAAGDVVECPARKGQVVDLAWSRYHTNWVSEGVRHIMTRTSVGRAWCRDFCTRKGPERSCLPNIRKKKRNYWTS